MIFFLDLFVHVFTRALAAFFLLCCVCMHATVLPFPLVPQSKTNTRKHDALLATSFSDIVALEATTKKLQQRAVDRKWLEPYRDPDFNSNVPQSNDKRAQRRSWQKKPTKSSVFPFTVRQSEVKIPSEDKVKEVADGTLNPCSLSYLLTLYRAAAVCQLLHVVSCTNQSFVYCPNANLDVQL